MRRSPMLQCLPRRASGKMGGERVKLRITEHGGASRPMKQRFVQLTVPAMIADQVPEDAVFDVQWNGRELVYRLVDWSDDG
jgi:hypothetical protein